MSVIKKNIPAIGLCICAFFIHSAVGQQTVQGADESPNDFGKNH